MNLCLVQHTETTEVVPGMHKFHTVVLYIFIIHLQTCTDSYSGNYILQHEKLMADDKL